MVVLRSRQIPLRPDQIEFGVGDVEADLDPQRVTLLRHLQQALRLRRVKFIAFAQSRWHREDCPLSDRHNPLPPNKQH